MKIDKSLFTETQESGQYLNIKPGAYVAKIIKVEDVTEKQYIKVYFDLTDSIKEYKDFFKKQQESLTDPKKDWPYQATLYKSYKPTAYPFLKSFTTALEKSNPGYDFEKTDYDHTKWVNKLMVVVFGEEETEFIDEETGLNVIQVRVQEVRSTIALQEGKIKTPERKLLSKEKKAIVEDAEKTAATHKAIMEERTGKPETQLPDYTPKTPVNKDDLPF